MTCKIFQMSVVACSTFLNRLAAVVRSRTVAKGDSITFEVLRCGQCSRETGRTSRVVPICILSSLGQVLFQYPFVLQLTDLLDIVGQMRRENLFIVFAKKGSLEG
jgi:hypothetical protein